MGVEILNNNNICVFHLHYYDLSTPKINDLRRAEFDNKVKIVSSKDEGLFYSLRDKIVPCLPISKCGWSTTNYRISEMISVCIATHNGEKYIKKTA